MNINQFASLVTREEGLKKSITVAQVKEVLRIVNKRTFGLLYGIIRLLMLTIIFSSALLAQTPINYWTADNGTNPANQVIDSRGAYNLNYASYSPGTVHIANTDPKVGNYIQLRSDNSIIQASGSTFPITSSFCIEFLLRVTHDWSGGEFMQDKGGAFSIWFELPSNGYAIPSVVFGTNTGNNVWDELRLSFDGIGRKNYGWWADGNWHHFVFQYNAATGLKEIWIDAERPTTDFYKNTAPGNISRSNTALGIILNTTTTYRRINADIDELAIYNTTLSQYMIQQHVQNVNAGQHYATSTSINTFATVSPTTSPIDTMEYAIGFSNQSVTYSGNSIIATKQPNTTAVNQLKKYPLARYRTGYSIPYLFNWCDLTYMAGKGQTLPAVTTPVLFSTISTSQYLQNITDLLHETTYNWNTAIASPEVGRTNEYGNINSYANSRIAKFANDSNQYPNTLITLKAQIGGCLECSKSLANNYYLQNSSGQFLTPDGNVTGTQSQKVLRPSNNPIDFIQDGNTMKSMVQAYVNALTSRQATNRINEINENGEVLAWLTNGAMSLDPTVVSDKNSSGLSWEDYQGQRFYELEKTSYRDVIFSINGLQNSTFSQYQINGFPEYKFKWSRARQVFTYKYNNQYLSTGDLYPIYPYGWRNITGAWNGIRHFTKARQAEIAVNDTMFRPFINAGFNYNEAVTVRPAQYLGMLKIMTGLGAISFYNGYFTIAQPFQIPANWIWQAAVPSYAQALITKVESIYKNSYLLNGDGTWNPDDAASGVSYLYNGGDYRKPVVVRKWNNGNKYLIYTAFMNNTNMTDTMTYTGNVVISFDGINNMTLQTRRQGSVYLFDNTVNPPTIVQLDGWHERYHPERWSQDLIIEGELADAGTYTVKTEGAAGYNFSSFNSYITQSVASPVTYNVQIPESSPATRYVWLRARNKTGSAVNATIAITGLPGKTIGCITSTSWQWYRVENATSTPISYTLSAKGKYNLTITPSNSNLEIDKIALLSSSADVYGALATFCSSVTATITPSGATTFCNGDSVTLSLNSADSYLWSTGATTQSIVVKTSGSYFGTVTIGGNQGVASPVTVTVNAIPSATITAGGAITFCPNGSVVLTAGSGSGYSYQWKKGGVNIGLATGQSYTANTAGAYSCQVTANGCSATSSDITVSILTPPTATITPSGATTFCSGGSVTLTSSSATSYLWSNAATTQSVNISASGTYAVTVTASNGCTATSTSVTVTVTSSPTAAISTSQTSICSGSSTVLTAQTGAGYSYQWKANGVNISGATGSTYSATTSSSYTCVVTASGCSVTSNSIAISVTPLPTTANAGVDQTICVDSAFLSANTSVNGSGLWTKVSGSGVIQQPSNPNSKVVGLLVGTSVFRWTITNSPCTASSDDMTITITATSAVGVSISASPNPFCNGATVSFLATPVNGGLATFQWKKNNVNVGSNINTYSGVFNDNDSVWVVMTSSLGCATGSPATSNKIYLDSSVVSAVASAMTATSFCNGDSVRLSVTNTAGYTWQWQNTSGNILGATDSFYVAKTSGAYKAVVTNSGGCSATSNTISVTVNTLPTAIITPQGSTSFCSGGNVTLTSSSATSYMWSTMETTQSISVSTPGTYTVTVTDGNGCTAVSAPITISTGALPSATITPNTTVSLCPGGLQVFYANTGAGLSYRWYKDGFLVSNVADNYSATTAGKYYVVVTNAASCSKSSDTVQVNISTPFTPTISNSRPLSFCGNDSTVLTSSSGSTYLWSTGATTQSITVKSSGAFSVTVTSGGCTAMSSVVTVTAGSATTPTITSPTPLVVCANGTVTLNSSNANSYKWNTGATTRSITAGQGTYYVTAYYANGCSATSSSVTVTDTCIATDCGVPFGLYTTNISKVRFCFVRNCGYARANWSHGNFTAEYYTLYYKNLRSGEVISVRKEGYMRRAYMYNLQNNTNYEWWLTATCNGVETDISQKMRFKTKR